MPGFAYACVATTPVPPVESPNSHVYETIVPSGSTEPDASNVAEAPGLTRNGLAVKSATDGCGPAGSGWKTTSRHAAPCHRLCSGTSTATLDGPRLAHG